MEEIVFFTEKQKYSKWWIFAMLFSLVGIAIFAIIQQVFLDKPFGNNPMSNSGLYALFICTLLFTLLFASFSLKTKITQDGIYAKFFPLSYKFYAWSIIKEVNVRTYNAIGEYGGWGYRWGIFGHGRALNIGGDKGLQIEFISGKKLLIGTQKAQELEAALSKGNFLPQNN